MKRSPQRRRRRERAGQPMLASRSYITAGCHQRRRRTWTSASMRRMIHRRALLETALSAATRLARRSIVDMPNPDSNARIETLLAAMTLGEKIGPMTLVSAGVAVSGPGGRLYGAERTPLGRRYATDIPGGLAVNPAPSPVRKQSIGGGQRGGTPGRLVVGWAAQCVDDRRILNDIVHVLRTGCCWQDFPAWHGPADHSLQSVGDAPVAPQLLAALKAHRRCVADAAYDSTPSARCRSRAAPCRSTPPVQGL